MRGLPALLAILLLSGLRASPTGAAGFDVVWTRSAGTTRGAVVALSSDGQIVASGAEKIQLWRGADGSLLRTLDAGEEVVSVTFAPDGQTLGSGHVYGDGYLWRVSDGQVLRTFNQGPLFAFTLDNRKLAVMGKGDNKVKLWELADDTLEYTIDTGSQFERPSLAIAPDGQYLATGAADARLWRVSDGAPLFTLPTIPGLGPGAVAGAGVTNLALSPDNLLLVYGLYNGSIVVTHNPYAPGQLAITRTDRSRA
jgi:WD40 repeat protein